MIVTQAMRDKLQAIENLVQQAQAALAAAKAAIDLLQVTMKESDDASP